MSSPGLMADDMKEIILMIRKKDKECFIGQMEENIKVAGKMENNMEKAFINLLAVNKSKESGKKEKDYIG